jgi:hypothetical protein
VPCTRRFTQHAPTEAASAAHAMSGRRNTLVCCFDPTSPRLTTFDIHEWLHSQLQVSEHSVVIIQIDGTRRQVFIKFTDLHFVQDIQNATNGETVYKHSTGEIYPVRLMFAGMGTRRIRLANLPRNSPLLHFGMTSRNTETFNPSKTKPGQNTIATLFQMERGLS